METDPQLWEGVLQALRSGQPVHPSVPWEQDAWLESYRAWRPAQSHEMWRAAGIAPGHRPGLRVLDVACGCAIKSFVLAQADPTVHITCLDRAEVLEVARALAERLHLLPQVTFLPADLHAVQFGADQYEAALLGQITHHLTPVQNQTLFHQIFHTLVPGGLLVIDVPLRVETEPPSEEVSLLNVALGVISGGAMYTVDDYRDWLQQSGFGEVRRLGERWLAAYKA